MSYKQDVDGYDLLIIAIIKQARRDLDSISNYQRKQAIAFFKSEWFTALTGMDGKDILKKSGKI